MPQPVVTLLAFSLLLLPSTAPAQRGGPAAPVTSEVFPVTETPMAETVTTVGTLRANESVDIVSELTKRLARVEVEEGALVEKDQVLFVLDDADLVAELGEIEARLKLAETNESRTASLLPQRAISRQDYDLARSELDILKAQKTTKEVELSKTRIRAPFSGRTGVRRVSEGALVKPETVLMSLQDLSRIKVDFTLPERYSAEIQPGQEFNFTVAGNANVFRGTVQVIEPAVDANTRSLLIRGICDDPRGLLPGGFAEVRLRLGTMRNGFAIPSQAVVPSSRGHGVYLLKDGKAEFREVEIGIRTEDKVQVLRGLAKGDQLLITNLLRLRPGVPVSPAEP